MDFRWSRVDVLFAKRCGQSNGPVQNLTRDIAPQLGKKRTGFLLHADAELPLLPTSNLINGKIGMSSIQQRQMKTIMLIPITVN